MMKKISKSSLCFINEKFSIGVLSSYLNIETYSSVLAGKAARPSAADRICSL